MALSSTSLVSGNKKEEETFRAARFDLSWNKDDGKYDNNSELCGGDKALYRLLRVYREVGVTTSHSDHHDHGNNSSHNHTNQPRQRQHVGWIQRTTDVGNKTSLMIHGLSKRIPKEDTAVLFPQGKCEQGTAPRYGTRELLQSVMTIGEEADHHGNPQNSRLTIVLPMT